MTTASTPALALSDVESFDPRAASGGTERISRCPICQSSKRAFHFNTQTGAYNCKRASCRATGKLSDFWQERPPMARRQRARAALNRAFALPDVSPPISGDAARGPDQSGAAPDPAAPWRNQWHRAQPLRSTPGAAYVTGRGIPPDLAHENGVRFCPAWAPPGKDGKEYSGGAAILFPMTDHAGALLACNGRYIRDGAKPKARTGGNAASAVFATYGALRCEVVTLCEGPFDALALRLCGLAAVALNGCNLPEWMPRALAFKRVLIASDNDAGGEVAAREWTSKLQAFGARCERLTPYRAKDFSEALQRDGHRATAAYLTARLAHIREFPWRA